MKKWSLLSPPAICLEGLLMLGLIFFVAACATPLEFSVVRIGGRSMHSTSIARGADVETTGIMEAASDTAIRDALKDFLNFDVQPPMQLPKLPGTGTTGPGTSPAPNGRPVRPPPGPEPGDTFPTLTAQDGDGNDLAVRPVGRTNPNKPTYRFNVPGSQIPGPLTYSIGGFTYVAGNPEMRYDYDDGSIHKPVSEGDGNLVFLWGAEGK